MSAEIPAGAMRFNSDSQKLEYWNGSAWFQVHTATPNLASAGDPTPGARGIVAGSYPSNTASIEYINIATEGSATSFGTLTEGRSNFAAMGDRTRGVFAGGYLAPGTIRSSIESLTYASTGSSVDSGFDIQYGGSTSTVKNLAGCSSSTRGLMAGGANSTAPNNAGSNDINYVTIQSLGNSLDFGNLTQGRRFVKGVSSPTRGVFMAGYAAPSGTIFYNIIDFVTISTTGDASDFGDLTISPFGGSTVWNATRGLHLGGYTPGDVKNCSYINIASAGNAVEFGELVTASHGGSGMSSPTRGVIGGMYQGGTSTAMEQLNLLTLGDAVTFGSLNTARYYADGCSNGHGGL
jgi:hypothetical protein